MGEHEIRNIHPAITLYHLDDYHLIVRIEFAGKKIGFNIGDSDMIALWGTLQTLDQFVKFEELQGIPVQYWFPIRSAREYRGQEKM